ncbi:hypothetical protein GT347_00015 [Xylophilus rhododendri]|uniref:F-box domain-containing protein n=1 Tax=Xylophilus rhododendri TaxID=2697032 RepID=A0A857IZS1_9BURK|nr:hypothetical protein [Xylophilus rhododendri]QHI96523.1 hypothetical protein GT347_00015 [Xylophilus rhododendri]
MFAHRITAVPPEVPTLAAPEPNRLEHRPDKFHADSLHGGLQHLPNELFLEIFDYARPDELRSWAGTTPRLDALVQRHVQDRLFRVETVLAHLLRPSGMLRTQVLRDLLDLVEMLAALPDSGAQALYVAERLVAELVAAPEPAIDSGARRAMALQLFEWATRMPACPAMVPVLLHVATRLASDLPGNMLLLAFPAVMERLAWSIETVPGAAASADQPQEYPEIIWGMESYIYCMLKSKPRRVDVWPVHQIMAYSLYWRFNDPDRPRVPAVRQGPYLKSLHLHSLEIVHRGWLQQAGRDMVRQIATWPMDEWLALGGAWELHPASLAAHSAAYEGSACVLSACLELVSSRFEPLPPY